jgi:protein gp37
MTSEILDVITVNWNPVKGCLHNCTYCWAKKYADRLKNTPKYADGFKPGLCERELSKTFKNEFVFAVDMGDLFGNWVPSEWINAVIDAVKQSPTSYFLFLTKNPSRYFEFLAKFPKNVVLGATVESNREYDVCKAPSTLERFVMMSELAWEKKWIQIEPIMDFDLEDFTTWIKNIKPIVVTVGYDNYDSNLPEPSLEKTLKLVGELEKFTKVRKRTMRNIKEKQK